MTAFERARFVQRRWNDLYAFAISFPIFGPLLFAVPALLIALLTAGCLWAISHAVGDRVWAWLLPLLVVEACIAGLLFLASYINLLMHCLNRCTLPEGAVLRVLTIESEQLSKVLIGAEMSRPPDQHAVDVYLRLSELGIARIRVDDPDEGEMRESTDGAFRVGWSPLRKYFVEWIEVPADWPGSVAPLKEREAGEAVSLTFVPHLNEVFERGHSTDTNSK